MKHSSGLCLRQISAGRSWRTFSAVCSQWLAPDQAFSGAPPLARCVDSAAGPRLKPSAMRTRNSNEVDKTWRNIRNYHALPCYRCKCPTHLESSVGNWGIKTDRNLHSLSFPGWSTCACPRCNIRLSSACFSSDTHSDTHVPEAVPADDVLVDTDYEAMKEEDHYLLPSTGHRVYLLQPDIKWGEQKNRLTSAGLQLAEACALVDSLPRWKVAKTATYSLKIVHKKNLYGKGNFELITKDIHKTAGITAVFVNIDMLTSLQLSTLQQEWNLPVYDRYTIVLQIFQTRARTREAKLQVALAEIPYLRSRLRGVHTGSLSRQKGGFSHVGGSGETYWQIRLRLLQERELKIKKALVSLKSKRQILKKERTRRQIPTVAVVGYTNAGKTSLIKALTGDQSMEPRNQLFATLDVTVHSGKLSNLMNVLYVDTVGFISDIPTDLIASFSATLEDMLQADVIIHVYDASHPDYVAQRQNVEDTLQHMRLPMTLHDNIINVANKVDLLKEVSDFDPDPGYLSVSCHTGEGLPELVSHIQESVLSSTDRVRKKLKVPMAGAMLSWLYKEASVESTAPCPNDTECLLVDVIMTPKQFAKFQARFVKVRRNVKQ